MGPEVPVSTSKPPISTSRARPVPSILVRRKRPRRLQGSTFSTAISTFLVLLMGDDLRHGVTDAIREPAKVFDAYGSTSHDHMLSMLLGMLR